MSDAKRTNWASSIRQRLLNLARGRNEEFQLILVRYAIERLLHRLNLSHHKDQFILKGAMLFQLWTGQPHRSTLDLDLLGKGEDTISRFELIFQEVCSIEGVEDGLLFPKDQIQARQIREDQRYSGVRVQMMALLGAARIPLQIDIGFGDVVTPMPEEIQYPSILGLPTPKLIAYPRETVVAEKFEALVTLGIANSRMKDFYDIWILGNLFEFDGELLGRAITATCNRRGTKVPEVKPLAFTSEFSTNPSKQAQWHGFLRRGKLLDSPPNLDKLLKNIEEFLWPVVSEVSLGGELKKHWPKGGPWRNMEK